MRVDIPKRRTTCAAAFVGLAVGIASGVVAVPTQEAKLTASNSANGDYFGGSVAVAGDTAVVGAYGKTSFRGAAYAFKRTGTNWTQEAQLVASDAASIRFYGQSVAIEGDTAVAGAMGNISFPSAAYVFTRTGTTWTEQAKLVGADVLSGDGFGISAALAGDTAIVGAHLHDSGRGAAYVFIRTGTTWTQQAELTASDAAANDSFGISVALRGDTAVVGAYHAAPGEGAAYVFTRAGTTWTQQAKLTRVVGATTNNFNFGQSVAVDRDTVVVGAPLVGSSGEVHFFTRTGTVWTRQARLVPTDFTNTIGLGYSVALVGDTAVVGAGAKDSNQGLALVFARTGTTWTEQSKLTAFAPTAGDAFGITVALAGDTAVVGAVENGNSHLGAAYVFTGVGPAAAPPPPPPPVGYCLPAKVKAKANAAQPAKSTLTASGTLETGIGVPAFAGAATFDVGGFHLDVPAFVAKGKSLTFTAGGITLTITPAKGGSSHATFSAKAVGDLAGKVDLNGPLTFNFTNAANNLNGSAKLTAGALGPHAVTAPTLSVLKSAATIKGGGKDGLKLTLGFATDGVVPVAGEDLTISFGGTYTSTLVGGWKQKGSTYVRTAKAPGITKATVDFAKGTITIAGSKLDLGTFATGGNAVIVTITRGADTRSAAIRMSRAGAKLAY